MCEEGHWVELCNTTGTALCKVLPKAEAGAQLWAASVVSPSIAYEFSGSDFGQPPPGGGPIM